MAWTGTRRPPMGDGPFAGRPEVGDPAGLAKGRLNEPGTVELPYEDPEQDNDM